MTDPLGETAAESDPGAPPPDDSPIGKVLHDRYAIVAPLGRGGMGTVYRGIELATNREVAIKLIHPTLCSDDTSTKRFLREAKLAGKLDHENLVAILDRGVDDELLYIVMELLDGKTLAAELAGGRLSVDRTVAIALQLCDALAAAHARGIVHRDLKPANIMLLPGDRIKVLDFGLAKSIVDASPLTNTDAMLGTPLYMAPEQISGKPTDARTDLYALGCILYEMLSGTPPFVDREVSIVLARHLGASPSPLPPPLGELVARLLAKAPADRLQHATDVRGQLAESVASEPSRSVGEAASERTRCASGTSQVVALGLADTQVSLRPSRARWVALAIGAAVAVALGLALLT